MATPVVTNKWAGNLDCDFCRRKRLMGDEFSKKALEKYRCEGGKLKCKQCVQQGEEAERQAAAERRAATASSAWSSASANPSNGDSGTAPNQPETRKCAGGCNQQLDYTCYNRNQWNKGDGKSKCRACVEEAISKELASQNEGKEDKLAAACQRVTMAHANGNALAVVKAESELAALQAEKVTGLKPIKMGRGGGGRGSAAGRSGRVGGGRLGRGRGRGR